MSNGSTHSPRNPNAGELRQADLVILADGDAPPGPKRRGNIETEGRRLHKAEPLVPPLKLQPHRRLDQARHVLVDRLQLGRGPRHEVKLFLLCQGWDWILVELWFDQDHRRQGTFPARGEAVALLRGLERDVDREGGGVTLAWVAHDDLIHLVVEGDDPLRSPALNVLLVLLQRLGDIRDLLQRLGPLERPLERPLPQPRARLHHPDARHYAILVQHNLGGGRLEWYLELILVKVEAEARGRHGVELHGAVEDDLGHLGVPDAGLGQLDPRDFAV
mmetsp:Transcript_5802/g.11251  ORF Transcript_5802/g.11251 Transcript_5802/m.11251 type:complete len:275 (-) Transcript_5802:172-996(-)